MRIREVTFVHRNDFTAIYECEHCASSYKLGGGYCDAFYHERVIPSLRRDSCGKNRAGETREVAHA